MANHNHSLTISLFRQRKSLWGDEWHAHNMNCVKNQAKRQFFKGLAEQFRAGCYKIPAQHQAMNVRRKP